MITINYINDHQDKYNSYLDMYNKIALKTLNKLELKGDYEVSVSLIDNNEIHKMNLDYRNKDYATDVITFENDLIDPASNVTDLGDIFISVDKAIEQAETYKHSIEREMSFLFVHGLLHTLGYDHLDNESEKIMFTIQEVILSE